MSHPEYSEQQLEAAVKEGMRSYLRYWCDTFRFPLWSKEEILSKVTLIDEHYLRDALAQEKGVVVSLPHAGNWDHAGAYYCEIGIPNVAVAEHLEPERLFKQFVAYRESLGMEILDASARSLVTLTERLRQGRLVTLVADRDLSSNGVPVTFFGYPARMPAGPAMLAIKTGAPFLTVFVRYIDTGN
ncbi:MAG: phosphatidylinositol mannoside acyltransferase [Actinomycetota bacterium]